MIEIAVAIIGSCGLVAAAVVPHMLRHGRQLEAVREQVQNSHTATNLRDDIDRALHGIDHLIDSVGLIRTDMAWERRERQDLSRRIERIEGVA